MGFFIFEIDLLSLCDIKKNEIPMIYELKALELNKKGALSSAG